MKIDAVDDNNEIKGTIKAVLAEATIDEDSLETLFVEGGECLEIETASFDSGWTEPCVPQCDGKQCGSDGCGGACGVCDHQACSAEGQCVPFVCDTLEMGEFELATVSSWYGSYKRYEAYVKDNAAGDPNTPDWFTMTFYTYDAEEDEWSYRTELVVGSETLADFENDETAIVMYEDYNEEEGTVAKYFVQESGTINITEVKEGTLESKGNGSVRLMEVDTDLVQIAGGKCYNIENMTWDTICIPQCEGKVCGDDGCGGTCGDGCTEDTTCNADQTACVAYSCDTIAFEEGSYNDYYGIYLGSYTPSTTEDDMYLLEVWTDENDTYNLYGTNYKTCDLCFIAYEGEDTTYFQQKGTVAFTYDEKEDGSVDITAVVSGLRIEQVTVADDYTSTPVAGGSCYNVTDTTISYTIPAYEEDY